ncbi:M14 family metallopeptidase [Peribacillus frigoritolerans]|uniref:M14 family metallopeptidase n=1 Tax=Peribacillus frigoritolerans TaxID=450367 RepID=UPI00207A490A|nr:M14 family metallopeptidase [Peribacillus frigoritolerans]USK77749.1 M14 family metallopeptidase [Peribacillus frigoritolerans]
MVDGDYVTKKFIGKSQATMADGTPVAASSIYDVWCYEFTPKNPEKTILLTAMIHGNEYTGFYWLTQFLDLLVNHWHEHPQFAYLRETVKIVTVPIANPYGFANQSRYNVNGTDCSRNFNYNWGVSLDEYPQGAAPFVEQESINIRDLMASIADECVASLDFHTTLSEGSTHHIIYFPRWLNNNISPYLSIIDQLKKTGETTAFTSVTLPTLTNWGVLTHGFIGANPEFKNGLYGPTRSSIEMTRAMEFFGNMVFQAAKFTFRNKSGSIDLPQTSAIKFNHLTDGGPIVFTTQTYTSQATKTSVRFKSKNEGIFEVDGFVTLTCDMDAEISILPQIYQLGSPDFDSAKTLDNEYNATIVNMKAGEERIIPIQAEITCHKTNILAADNTNTTQRAREIVFQLRTKISAGQGSIKFIKARAKFLPSTSGDRFRKYGLNPARIIYPTGEETKYEF